MYVKYIETELEIYNLIWFNDIQNRVDLETKKNPNLSLGVGGEDLVRKGRKSDFRPK